jgi:hypothetical protein
MRNAGERASVRVVVLEDAEEEWRSRREEAGKSGHEAYEYVMREVDARVWQCGSTEHSFQIPVLLDYVQYNTGLRRVGVGDHLLLDV